MTALPSAPVHLLDFGPYILHDISTILCKHCQPKAITLGWQENCFLEGDDPSTSLASLSSSCRLLRDIAQPVLYHDVDPQALMPFLLTILAQPDLAASVRSFSNSRIGVSKFTAEDRLLIQALARAAGVSLPGNWAGSSDSRASAMDLVDGLITDHLLAYLPRLATLHHTRIAYPCLGRLLGPAGLVLGSLKRLELGQWDVEEAYTLQLNSQTTPLFASAPNLQCLKVHLCTHVEPGVLPLQNLRFLKITNGCLSQNSLSTLVSACPRLEGFGYETVWQEIFPVDREISPGNAQRILKARKDTLKYLNLDFGGYYLEQSRWRSESTEDYVDSFLDFEVLEKLVISLVWIQEDEVPGNDALVSILPESIRLLAVPCDGRDGLLHGLVKVAMAVAQGRFPHLKKVQFDVLAGASEEIAEACAMARIEGGTLQAAFGHAGAECGHYAEYEEFLDFP